MGWRDGLGEKAGWQFEGEKKSSGRIVAAPRAFLE